MAADLIKAVRKAVKDKYKGDANAKALWAESMKSNRFGKYIKTVKDKKTNKKKQIHVGIGVQAAHHILDSQGIRDEMHSIIPSNCNLTFKFPTYVNNVATFDFDFTQYQRLATVNLSEQFEHKVSQMKEFIDVRLYSSDLCIKVRGKSDHFWCKMLNKTKSALSSAMGIQKSTYIMRYRPDLLVHHSMGDVVMIMSGINVGIGFCNFNRETEIKGHKMIHFEDEYMSQYQLTFYGKNGITIEDIQITLKSKDQPNTKMLFNGRPAHIQNNNHIESEEHVEMTHNTISPPPVMHDPYYEPQYYPQQPLDHRGYTPYRSPTNSVHSYRDNPMTCHPPYPYAYYPPHFNTDPLYRDPYQRQHVVVPYTPHEYAQSSPVSPQSLNFDEQSVLDSNDPNLFQFDPFSTQQSPTMHLVD